MRPLHFFWLGLAALAAGGCQGGGQTAALEREHRVLEDNLYALQDLTKNYERDNRELQEKVSLLQDDLARCRGETGSERASPSRAAAPPRPSRPARAENHEPAFELPKVEVSEPAMPSGKLPPRLQPRGKAGADAAPSDPGPALPEPLGSGADARRRGDGVVRAGHLERPPADSAKVVQIALHPLYTGAMSQRELRAPGIRAVLQPTDGRSPWLRAPAAISAVAVDPALPEGSARIARWQWTAAQVAELCRQPSAAPGIPLEMTWPSGPPAHDRIYLFVRYTTSDGRRLEANQQLDLSRPAALAIAERPNRFVQKIAAARAAPLPGQAPPPEAAAADAEAVTATSGRVAATSATDAADRPAAEPAASTEGDAPPAPGDAEPIFILEPGQGAPAAASASENAGAASPENVSPGDDSPRRLRRPRWSPQRGR